MKRVDMSATEMLREDHAKVRKLFSQYKEELKPSEKETLVQMICMELHIHTVLEEEIFYPKVRKALHNDKMMNEALEEHSEVKLIIDQLQRLCADEDKNEFRSKVQELKESVEHHVREEEDEMFPQVEQSKMDLVELGQELAERKAELTGPAHPEAAEYEGEEKKKVLAGVGVRSRMQPEKEEEHMPRRSSAKQKSSAQPKKSMMKKVAPARKSSAAKSAPSSRTAKSVRGGSAKMGKATKSSSSVRKGSTAAKASSSSRGKNGSKGRKRA